MTTLVQAAIREVPVAAPDFAVLSLWCLLGLTLSLAVAHFGMDFSPLS